jgi:proteasome lid subunit RPN8/RPN11
MGHSRIKDKKGEEKSAWSIGDGPWSPMLRHAMENYPEEACGILLSHPQEPTHIIEVYSTKNTTVENPATRYTVDPLEYLEVDRWAEEEGLDICGIYHSHPDHPARPSEHDRTLAYEGYLYIILSVKSGTFDDARAWLYIQEFEQFKEVILQKPVGLD